MVLKLQDIGWAGPFNPKDVEKGKAGKNDTLTKFVVFAFLGTFVIEKTKMQYLQKNYETSS